MKKPIELPSFQSEDEEREFWANIDLSEHIDSGDLRKVSFPNLKPTSRSISIRFPVYVLDAVKQKANELGIPYQSLIKKVVAESFVGPD